MNRMESYCRPGAFVPLCQRHRRERCTVLRTDDIDTDFRFKCPLYRSVFFAFVSRKIQMRMCVEVFHPVYSNMIAREETIIAMSLRVLMWSLCSHTASTIGMRI